MYQKQGIGKMLMKNAINFAKENGFVKIQLEVYKENRNAINMYVKFKFRKNDSIKMQSFLMELDLNDI
jgi:ribosomal protein S18 acetylase RimI-like enzyme